MARITNREAVQAIADMAEFTTGTGSLRGVRITSEAVQDGTYYAGSGRLTNPDELAELSEAVADNQLAYVVFSYSTPIAWVIAESQWVWDWTISDARYSVTTSRHQSIARQGVALEEGARS